jgi:mannose-6-phosphate isomerase
MNTTPLYPLRFEPIFQYRLWGGRRLEGLVSAPLPEDPIGEAWLLSDRDDYPTCVAEGPLKGQTLSALLAQSPVELLGKPAGAYDRFPLLLKFLDACDMLSVQVHPSDDQKELLPEGELGKTEAWVVLDAEPGSSIYAGMKTGVTPETLSASIADGTVADHLSSFSPKAGDGLFLQAGTVHALGKGVVVFEVQENSDVTFRLFDWNRVDEKTGQTRPLQVEQAMACIDFDRGPVAPVKPVVESVGSVKKEAFFECDHFGLWRFDGSSSFTVGKANTPRVLVCLDGEGHLEYAGADYAFRKGDVLLLPAVVGTCPCRPNGRVSMIEISLPEIG